MSAFQNHESQAAVNVVEGQGRGAYVLGLMSCAPLLVGAFVLAEAGSKARELDKDYVMQRDVMRQVAQGLEGAADEGRQDSRKILVVDFDQASRDAADHVDRLRSTGFSSAPAFNVGAGLMLLGGIGLGVAGVSARYRPR